ncbi:MAG: GntR family transcriptional regulator [Epulopiscium sp.]|nr:GntR family transcriptional regulator [Candidatus Epulonipiscium sp.]
MIDERLKVDVNQYLPLRDVVFNTLREAILKGDLTPGERLMEKQLAEMMGVSRTPIREAIRKLELEGLVVMAPRKGAQVAEITEKDLQDVLEVRAALEALAVRLACEKMKKEELDKLRRTMEEFKEAADAKDVYGMIDKDVEFHDIIFRSTENERLMQIVNNLREQIYRYRVAYLKHSHHHTGIQEEHEDILRVIEEKRVEEAENVATVHIHNQEKAVIQLIREENKKEK